MKKKKEGLHSRIFNTLAYLEKCHYIDASEEEYKVLVQSIYDSLIDFLAHRTDIVSFHSILDKAFMDVGWGNLPSTDLVNQFEEHFLDIPVKRMVS